MESPLRMEILRICRVVLPFGQRPMEVQLLWKECEFPIMEV